MRGTFKSIFGIALLAGAAVAASGVGAAASTLPSRKDGLWQTSMTMTMHMVMDGQTMDRTGAPMVDVICANAANDEKNWQRLMSGAGSCTKADISNVGDVYTMHATCTTPQGPAEMTAVVTKESDTAYHVETHVKGASLTASMTGDSRWLSACPAGVMPGDRGTMVSGKFVKNAAPRALPNANQ